MKNEEIKRLQEDLMISTREKYKKLGLDLVVQAILKDYLFEKSQGSGVEIEEFVSFSLPCYLESPTEEIHDLVMEIFLEQLKNFKNKKK